MNDLRRSCLACAGGDGCDCCEEGNIITVMPLSATQRETQQQDRVALAIAALNGGRLPTTRFYVNDRPSGILTPYDGTLETALEMGCVLSWPGDTVTVRLNTDTAAHLIALIPAFYGGVYVAETGVS